MAPEPHESSIDVQSLATTDVSAVWTCLSFGEPSHPYFERPPVCLAGIESNKPEIPRIHASKAFRPDAGEPRKRRAKKADPMDSVALPNVGERRDTIEAILPPPAMDDREKRDAVRGASWPHLHGPRSDFSFLLRPTSD